MPRGVSGVCRVWGSKAMTGACGPGLSAMDREPGPRLFKLAVLGLEPRAWHTLGKCFPLSRALCGPHCLGCETWTLVVSGCWVGCLQQWGVEG